MSAVVETSAGVERGAGRRSGTRKRHTYTALVLLAGVALWAYVGFVGIHLLGNSAFVQLWILLSAAVAPGTLLWVMVHRLRPTDTLTPGRLVIAAAVGGALSIAVGGTFDALVGFNGLPKPWHGILPLDLAGVVEEASKALLVVILGWRVAKTARNGLFLGGAVGVGFAIIETCYYVSSSMDPAHPLESGMREAVVRGVLSPFMHPLWSALLGAAIFGAARATGRYRLTLGVVGAYLGVALLHGSWDGLASTVAAASGLTGQALASAAGLGTIVLAIPFAVGQSFLWRAVARRANRSEQPSPTPSSEPVVS